MQELPVTAYLDRFSARPGETLALQASLQQPGPCRVSLVRIVCADPNPAGPGLDIRDLSRVFQARFQGRHQPLHPGSFGVVEGALALAPVTTWTAWVWPTLAREHDQTVLAGTGERGAVELAVAGDGAVLTVRDGVGAASRLATGEALPRDRWVCIWASLELATGRVTVGQAAPATGYRSAARTQRAGRLGNPGPSSLARVLMGVADPARGETAPRGLYNGRLEDPMILSGEIAGERLLALDLATPPRALLAGWDFSRDMDSWTIRGVGPRARDGRLLNLPTRAVRGRRWAGESMDWRQRPRDYAAVHFHEDGVGDCGWQTDLHFTVPVDLPSGVYGLKLDIDGASDTVPFFVLPPRRGKRAAMAYLAATFTYQAYANHARGNTDAAYQARVAAWGANPYNPDDYPVYGASTYNNHPDGSGICYSSRRRPILTLRPGFLSFDDPRGSGLRHFPADSHLLAWLDARGHAVDVITDEDLHVEGEALLKDYRVLLTGAHPEYHTGRTLDAIQGFVAGGGRLAYLGGNGFYWRIGRNDAQPDLLEVRRAEGGIRAWAAEPGEYYHSLDGQYGGLWRRQGRPPQQLAAVGFTAQGLFEGTGYRRLPASFEPAMAWLFQGLDGEILGDFGLSGGGAAGFELDRADARLGTPPGTVILARSENHPAHFVTVPEELLSHIRTVSGESPTELIRAEMTYSVLPGGGAIFAVGSITFCGSLPVNGFENNISRLLDNLLRGWLSPATRA